MPSRSRHGVDMKIAIVVPSIKIHGGIGIAFYYAMEFHKLGNEVDVICLAHEVYSEWYPIYGVRIICCQDEWLLKKAAKDHYDFAIATFWPTVHVLRNGMLSTSRIVYLIQGDEENFYASGDSYTRALVADTMRGPEIKIVVSGWLQRVLMARYPTAEFHLIQNGIEFERFSSAKAFMPKGKRLRVLVEGPIGHRPKHVIEILSTLRSIGSVDLWLVSSIKREVAGSRPDLSLFGVPYNEMPSIYASCDVIVKWSDTEGFSLPILEMMATGGIPIVNKFGGQEDMLDNGINGFVNEKLDADYLSGCLTFISSNYETLSAAAKRRAQEMAWQDQGRRIIDLVEDRNNRSDPTCAEQQKTVNVAAYFQKIKASSVLRGWISLRGGGDIHSAKFVLDSQSFEIDRNSEREDVAQHFGVPGVYGFVIDKFLKNPPANLKLEYRVREDDPISSMDVQLNARQQSSNGDVIICIDEIVAPGDSVADWIVHSDDPPEDLIVQPAGTIRGWAALKDGGDIPHFDIVVGGVTCPVKTNEGRTDVAEYFNRDGDYGFVAYGALLKEGDEFVVSYRLAESSTVKYLEAKAIKGLQATNDDVAVCVDDISEADNDVALKIDPSGTLMMVDLIFSGPTRYFLDGNIGFGERISLRHGILVVDLSKICRWIQYHEERKL